MSWYVHCTAGTAPSEIHSKVQNVGGREAIKLSRIGVHPFGMTQSMCQRFGVGRVVDGGPLGTLGIPLLGQLGEVVCFFFWERHSECWYYPSWLDREAHIFNAHCISPQHGLNVARNPLEAIRLSMTSQKHYVALLTEKVTTGQIAQIQGLAATKKINNIKFF
jgi:hypothetical protein